MNLTYDIIFERGVVDNDGGNSDGVPEVVVFERGDNSDVRLQAIIGGDILNPVLSSTTIDVTQSEFEPIGIFINTQEIDVGQQLAGAGVDLSDFGVAPNQPIYGLRLIAYNNSGPDLYGTFSSAADPDQLRPVPPELSGIPEPRVFHAWLLITGVAATCLTVRRIRARRLNAMRQM